MESLDFGSNLSIESSLSHRLILAGKGTKGAVVFLDNDIHQRPTGAGVEEEEAKSEDDEEVDDNEDAD